MTFTVRVLDPRTDPEPAGWAAFREALQALGFGTRSLFSVTVPRPVLGR